MHNVLILGCEGMLGWMVTSVLSRDKQFNISGTTQEETRGFFKFNVKNGIERLQKIFEGKGGFDYVVNCIGILNSNIDENDSKSVSRAILINSLFPHTLASLAQDTSSRVIQISTDGVFAKNAGLCTEGSPANCDDVYGKTKRLGEVNAPNYLNLRCSIIGPSPYLRKGLLEWFLAQPKKVEVGGFTNQLWNGITTLQFANLCRMIITDDCFDVIRHEATTHHFCPNKSVTKFELLELFKAHYRPDIVVNPTMISENCITRTLDTQYQKVRELYGYNYPMQHAIEELIDEI